ncbi:DUF262 domain-containing protein [Mucilaginibacter litoreus]|uniref:DUF262 domain-containing protein n=1 Tax=Mucilaginibacter litoreus TaxID=1048221 RepID=A0ABW3AM68_9SPHI
MKIESKEITIKDAFEQWDRIDPKPQYQRTPVWQIDRKRLLVDSILRGYDLPKFYLNRLNGNAFFDFEVCDGQQRLRTIHEFINGGFSLGKDTIIDSRNLSGLSFEDLPAEVKTSLNNYKLTYAVIVEATHNEIRDLFARLQKGMGLNQAELRRALSTNIGVYVETIVNTNNFFKNCGISDVRNKHQDYIDHVIAFIVNGFDRDLKGQYLKDVYTTISPEGASDLVRKINQVLEQMEKINSYANGIFKNKWAFVDAFILIYQNLQQGRVAPPKPFARELEKFEVKRKQNNRAPNRLIENLQSTDEDKRLYTYISSFQKDGALKNNLRRRNEAFTGQFNFIFS